MFVRPRLIPQTRPQPLKAPHPDSWQDDRVPETLPCFSRTFLITAYQAEAVTRRVTSDAQTGPPPMLCFWRAMPGGKFYRVFNEEICQSSTACGHHHPARCRALKFRISDKIGPTSVYETISQWPPHRPLSSPLFVQAQPIRMVR